MARLFLAVACLSLFLLAVESACPNNCNGNGVCEGNSCRCDPDWMGDDCSISCKLVESGVPLTNQDVPTRQWRYFHMEVTQPATLTVRVEQTSDGGDIDTYVKVGSRPSKAQGDYDARDITTSKDVTLQLEEVEGMVYVGLYGYRTATATITVTVQSVCPNDCSGAGECTEGVCICAEGHAGLDCSIDIITLEDSRPVAGRVAAGEWQYFQATYSEDRHNTVLFVVRQAQPYPQNDCNLYVKYFWLPRLNFYDYRDVSRASEYKVGIASPNVGSYYAGVYGSNDCDFNITLYLQEPDCPNKCSGPSHGTCNDVTFECNCNRNFAGKGCNTMIPALVFQLPVYGFVHYNSWNIYTLNTFSSANALLTLKQLPVDPGNDEFDPDCDLYVALDRDPTVKDYDYRDITYRSEYSLLIGGEGRATWKVGVHGYAKCNYSLTATLAMACPNDCTNENQGTCIDGTCSCKPGFSGDDCSSQLNVLENGVDVVGTVASGEWEYYTFTVQAGSRATVYMRESLTTGFIWLFANPSHANNPALYNHEYGDIETGVSVHVLSIDAQSSPLTYVIGVHGNAFSVGGSELEYSLVAYQPLFD